MNSPDAIDAFIKRYMANVGIQNAPQSPLLSLFGSTPEPGQIISLDLTSILGNTTNANSSTLASSPTGYLLNMFQSS